MSKFKADIYFEDVYVKTVFVEADDEYTALDDLVDWHVKSVTYDIEELDTEL